LAQLSLLARRGDRASGCVKYVVAFALILAGCSSSDTLVVSSGDPEERVVLYLKANLAPGKPVLVTDLLNDVFTTPEEQAAVKRLYDATFALPAFVAMTQVNTGKIPTLSEITSHFGFKVPGTTEVLLRVLETDPRVPPFFQRDASTGEIKAVDVEAIRNADRFGDPFQR
jgi:hypothetical protein